MQYWTDHPTTRAATSVQPGAAQAGAAVGVVWAVALATQYVAARLAYHPHLGPWIYRASAVARDRLRVATIICCVAAIMALPMHRWRWGAVLLGFAAVTAIIARQAPLYSPERVFVWYAAYHTVREYRQLFVVTWLICGTVAVVVTIAIMRLTVGDRPSPRAAPTRWDSRALQRLPVPIASRALGSDSWHQRAVGAIASGEGAKGDGSLDSPLPGEAPPAA